jgi:peptidoglycan/xylan/chitin deacetylase (PgdA/CDA1 family)
VALVLIATLAACDSPPRGQSNSAGAQPAPSLSPSSSASTPPGAPGAPASSAGAPSSSAKPGRSATSNAPAGSTYAGRLPRFGRPPKAHRINLPESSGAAYFSRIPTDQPVAFLTIDDGWVKHPEALELFKESDVPVTLFLTINAIKDDPAYFKRLQDTGAVIEAHTLTHPELKGKPYSFQHKEICGSADQLANMYGKRPTLFRPPFGDKDATTLKAAHDCGLKAGFFWKETVDKGIVRFQDGNRVQQGDIILMHFRDRFVDDYIAALQAISAAGLTPALLEDYIPD